MRFPTSRNPSLPTERDRRRHHPRRPGRHRARRSGKPRILILCEGTKTETSYFSKLKNDKRLTSVVVKPTPSGPRGLWERTNAELREDRGWDEVYCVVDHDGRVSEIIDLDTKLATLDRRYRSSRVEMILSDPCFEYWLLLHFEFTDRPFTAQPHGRTACDEVIKTLRHHLADYSKNDSRNFKRLEERLDYAMENARRLDSTRSSGSPRSPRTDVPRLIKRLQRLTIS